MTDDPKHNEDDAEQLPGEHSSSPDDVSDSAWAEEARDVVEGGTGADVGDDELDQQAFAAEGDLDDDGDIDEDDRALAASRGRKTAAGEVGVAGGGPRFVQFLRASWAELRRVQWPDRRQVSQATAVVLGFVIIAGAYLGAADWVAQKLVNFIL